MEELITKGHLTKEERDKISILHAQEKSISQIESILNQQCINNQVN